MPAAVGCCLCCRNVSSKHHRCLLAMDQAWPKADHYASQPALLGPQAKKPAHYLFLLSLFFSSINYSGTLHRYHGLMGTILLKSLSILKLEKYSTVFVWMHHKRNGFFRSTKEMVQDFGRIIDRDFLSQGYLSHVRNLLRNLLY